MTATGFKHVHAHGVRWTHGNHDTDSETCKVVVQTNNVEVDQRGYIYAADRANSGLHIIELTDEAKQELTRRAEAGTPPYEEN